MKKLYLALSAVIPLLNAATEVRLERGVPVHLRLKQPISSETARVNETVEFEVVDDVVLDGAVVIAKGNIATARVADAAPAGRLMRNGRLAIDIESVAASNGATVKLRAGNGQAAKSHDSASDSIGALPALPFTMFEYGKVIEIPAGKLVTVYTASALTVGSRAAAASPAQRPEPLAGSSSVLPALHATPGSDTVPVEAQSSPVTVSNRHVEPAAFTVGTNAAAPSPEQRPVAGSSSVLPALQPAPGSDAVPIEAQSSRVTDSKRVTEPTASLLPSTRPGVEQMTAPTTDQPAPERNTVVKLQPAHSSATAGTSKSKKILTIVAVGAAVGVAGVLAAKGHGGSGVSAAGISTASGAPTTPTTTVGIGGITVGGPH